MANSARVELQEEVARTKRVAERICHLYQRKATNVVIDEAKLLIIVYCLIAVILLLVVVIVFKFQVRVLAVGKLEGILGVSWLLVWKRSCTFDRAHVSITEWCTSAAIVKFLLKTIKLDVQSVCHELLGNRY